MSVSDISRDRETEIFERWLTAFKKEQIFWVTDQRAQSDFLQIVSSLISEKRWKGQNLSCGIMEPLKLRNWRQVKVINREIKVKDYFAIYKKRCVVKYI